MNAYTKNISSGTIVAMLVLSGLLVLVPLATTVHATQNATLPTLTASPNVVMGTTATPFSVVISNPISNAYAIQAITFSAPTGWAFSGTPSCGASFLLTVKIASASAIECGWDGSHINTQLNPGFSDTLNLGMLTGPGSSASSPAVTAVFSTAIIDSGSTPAAYPGPTFTEYNIATVSSDDLTVTLSPTSSTFVAGSSPYTVTVTLDTGQQGVPITFSITSGSYPTSGFTSTLSPASGFTGSTGMLSTTWVPSNWHADHTSITATIGTTGVFLASGSVQTIASIPSKVSFTLSAAAFPNNHYLSTYGTTTFLVSTGGSKYSGAYDGAADMAWAVTDAFGNPAVATVTSGTLTAATPSTGSAYFDTATPLPTTESIGLSGTVPNYVQTGTFGTIGKITATIAGTYGSSSTPFSVSGFTGNLVTGTFQTATQPTPYSYGAPSNEVQAGSSFSVNVGQAGLADAQSGVPVTLYAVTCSSSVDTPQTGTFASSGTSMASLVTNSSGEAVATFMADTMAGAQVRFQDNISAPTDANPSNTLGGSLFSTCVKTIPGSPATLIIQNYFYDPSGIYDDLAPTMVVAGSVTYIDVSLADAYGNAVSNEQSFAIQVALVVPAPLTVSSTTLYIYSGCSDTMCDGSYGPAALTFPSSMGLGAQATVTASGVVNGKTVIGTSTFTVVSPLPSLGVKSPMISGGVFYTNSQTVVFQGTANVSAALPAKTDDTNVVISSVQYKINSGAWQSAAIATGNTVTWSVAATFPLGLNTIQFRANDSSSTPNVVTSSSYQLLVDTMPPTIKFPTTTTVNTGSVTLAVSDSLGDLNTSSIMAWWGTSAIPAASITWTGSNTLGSNSTFTVTVAGLAPGTNTLKISASDFAGNTATASQTFTVSILQIDTFTLSTPLAQTTQGGLSGVSATLTNNGVTANANVWFQLLNSQNQVVIGPVISGGNFAAGATNTFFFGFGSGLAHGTYTAQVFVQVGGNAYSQTFTLTVTV